MTFTSTQLTVLINDMAQQRDVTSVSARNTLYNLFKNLPRSQQTSADGDGYDWKYTHTGNTAANSYAAGAEEPSAVAQGTVSASVTWRNHWVPHSFQRSAIEDADNSVVGNVVSREMMLNDRDLLNDLDVALAADGTGNSSADCYGIAYYVASSGTIAGVVTGTYSGFASTVTTSVGALAEADIQSAEATLYGPTKKGVPKIAVCNPTVWNIVGNLLDSSVVPQIQTQGAMADPMVQAIGGFTAVYYNGVAYLRVPGYTTQRLDLLDTDDWLLLEKRPFVTDPFERDGDNISSITTWRGALVCERPYAQHGLTGISS